MNHTLAKISLAAGVLLSCLPTFADTFTFDGLPGANEGSFSSYSESGFTVKAVDGQWKVAKIFGNPTPDIFCNCAVGTVSFSGDANELFQFTSVDLAYWSADYSITGLLQNNPVFTQSGTIGSDIDFYPIVSEYPQSILDELTIQLSPGTGPGFNIDNISYNIVPSPSAGALAALSLLCTAFVRGTKLRNV